MKTGLIYCIAAVALLTTIPCTAHMLNMTHIGVQTQADGTTEIKVRIDLGQSLMSAAQYWALAKASPGTQTKLMQPTIDKLAQGLLVSIDSQPTSLRLRAWDFPAASLEAIKNPLTPQMASLTYQLDGKIDKAILLELANTLIVPWPCLIRLDIAGRELPISRLLTDYDRSSGIIEIKGGATQSNTNIAPRLVIAFQTWLPSLSWMAVGFQHIIPLGLDHIAFVLGLFFLTSNLRLLLLQVTCFTLAHSLTLGLAMHGFISVPAAIVEPLIAVSIIYIAIDNLYTSQLAPFRLLLVTSFGLLHGLGFASALQDIQLPQESFLTALLLFNVGVELGQITVLAGAFALVGWFRRYSWYTPGIAHPATMAIAGIGTYWLLKRIIF